MSASFFSVLKSDFCSFSVSLRPFSYSSLLWMNNLFICFHRKVWNVFLFWLSETTGYVGPVTDFIRVTGITDRWDSVTCFLKEPHEFLQPLSTTWQEVSKKAQKPSTWRLSLESCCENKRIISFSFKLRKCWNSAFCCADIWHFSTLFSLGVLKCHSF